MPLDGRGTKRIVTLLTVALLNAIEDVRMEVKEHHLGHFANVRGILSRDHELHAQTQFA